MRKIILGLVAAAAVAAPLALASTANAAVTYDDQSVGVVGKGDVQTAVGGINDAVLQDAWKTGNLRFVSLYQMDNNTRWSCSDGSVGTWTIRTIQSRVLNATPATNAQNKVTSGWTLNGIDQTKGGTFVRGERIGTMGACPAGSYMTGFVSQNPADQFVNTVLPGVKVTYNGTSYDLPVTPVAVPAA
jgi:hypothetical protein